MRRVVITGLGAVSSIGCGKEDYWSALAAGKNGAGKITLFNTEGHRVNIAAEVKDFDPEKWFDKKDARRADRFIHFAVAAASLAVEDAKLDVKAIDGNMFGVYLGSGEGGFEVHFMADLRHDFRVRYRTTRVHHKDGTGKQA